MHQCDLKDPKKIFTRLFVAIPKRLKVSFLHSNLVEYLAHTIAIELSSLHPISSASRARV